VSVFLVNHRVPSPDAKADESFAFQAAITVRSEAGFVPRPNVRGRDGGDWDEKVADLQYRSTCELAVGHGVATSAEVGEDRACREVSAASNTGAIRSRTASRRSPRNG